MSTRALAAALCFCSFPAAATAADFTGFTAASRDEAARIEKVFAETPSPQNARKLLFALTEDAHVAGTPAEKKVAEYVRDRFKELGFETEMVKYDVFLNHPKTASLKLVAPVEEELSLVEAAYDVDKDSNSWGVFPAFHGYGASGKAEGQVVYVNYGTKADFERLTTLGVSVEGKVALVRYGDIFRGLKVKEAQDRGAVGVLIYSDPEDDGYMRGDVYPDGPMRPPSGIQRGSVQFLSLGPGDPSTPGGVASTATAKRLTRDKMANVPKIPSLPISYAEAEKILRHLGGPRVPDEWQGGLPFSYHVGPGGAVVSMAVEMDEGLKPIFNVIARIPGTVEPESLVVLGNHRDAWTHGAVDPNSGTTAMIETARGLAAALKAGWKPKRTILLASWDAEEYGLVGSTEWGEDQQAKLAKAVAYLNLDAATAGSLLDVSGVPSLRDVVREAAAAVAEPKAGGSLLAAWEKREREDWARQAPVDLGAADKPFELRLDPLGSGSDYTVFLDHLGVPSLDFGFGGPYGVYHAVYDNFRWMDEFGDPGFLYHTAAARFYGALTLRLAGADAVPLRFSGYAASLRVDLDRMRRAVIRKNRSATAEAPSLDLDFAPLLGALDAFESAGRGADKAVDAAVAAGKVTPAMNDGLAAVERAFLDPAGLPNRPWFRHLLFAPGTITGYEAWPFPGLQQAVEDKDKAMFERERDRVIAALGRAAERLKAVAGGAS
jgi:N-acetylated-alpha-linked acidic dipeptidase